MRRHRAFTLVEVMVAIGIVGVLVGLVLPVLSRVKAAGRGTQCLSNLKQMSIAAQLYGSLFDAWPAAIRYEHGDDGFRQIAWDWVTTFDGTLVGPGPLWTFTGNPGRVQQCPDHPGPAHGEADPFTGYNYNTSYLGGEAVFPATGWAAVSRGVPPHACSRSSQCAMFGDGGRSGGTNKFMRAPGNREARSLDVLYAGGQSFRHTGGTTNVAYADGHVAASGQPRSGTHANDVLLEQVMGFPSNGFLSDDDTAYAPR